MVPGQASIIAGQDHTLAADAQGPNVVSVDKPDVRLYSQNLSKWIGTNDWFD